jgi:hypothetical protein
MLEMTGKFYGAPFFPYYFLFVIFSPVFDGIFDFCSMYTGASLESATKLNNEVQILA